MDQGAQSIQIVRVIVDDKDLVLGCAGHSINRSTGLEMPCDGEPMHTLAMVLL